MAKTLQFGKKLRLFSPEFVMLIKKKGGFSMLALAVLIGLVLLAFVGGDWFLSRFNSDDLSDMGIEKR